MRRSALIFFSLAVVAAATVASCRRSSTEPSPVCTITIAPESHTAPAEGGTRTVAVTASDESCMWTASSKVPWVAITAGASGAGSATLVYAVAANQSPDERTGTLEISDKVHTITQAGQGAPPPPPTCTYSLSPTQVEVDFIGGTGTVQVATGEGCDWTAESDAAWLTIEDGATGSGPGSFRYRVAEHSDSGTRTATVTVVDQVFTVEQTGVDQTACTYSVIPVEHEPCMPGGSVTTRIETAPGCRWTAASTADWLTVGLASGHGPAELTMHFTDNYRAPRTGVVEIRWTAPTAGQNVRVAQAGCLYSTPTPVVTVPAAGGTVSFDVLQQATPNVCGGPLQDRCIWTAATTTPWITVTSTMPRQGDQPVQLLVAANPSTSPRTGTVTVEDMTVQIQQAGTTP